MSTVLQKKAQYWTTRREDRSCQKIQRLSNSEVSDFIVKEEIKTETAAVANEQRKEKKKDLANFVLSHTSKESE